LVCPSLICSPPFIVLSAAQVARGIGEQGGDEEIDSPLVTDERRHERRRIAVGFLAKRHDPPTNG
jgi:hypothetical protein